uniref:Translocon-associated protein subunit gamma n=1 Tax=Capra hircus TaxID=9925 RepID=A0A8C2NC47_CAPHI
MAPKGGPKQQSEEDLLLQDFSRNLSAKSSALFFGNAFIVSAIPIWLYWRIWHMDLIQSAVLYSVMTLVSTYLVAFAYKNVKFVLKHKVAQKREDAVSKEVTRKLSEADNRKMSRKEKDERILWKKNEVADCCFLLYSEELQPHSELHFVHKCFLRPHRPPVYWLQVDCFSFASPSSPPPRLCIYGWPVMWKNSRVVRVEDTQAVFIRLEFEGLKYPTKCNSVFVYWLFFFFLTDC